MGEGLLRLAELQGPGRLMREEGFPLGEGRVGVVQAVLAESLVQRGERLLGFGNSLLYRVVTLSSIVCVFQAPFPCRDASLAARLVCFASMFTFAVLWLTGPCQEATWNCNKSPGYTGPLHVRGTRTWTKSNRLLGLSLWIVHLLLAAPQSSNIAPQQVVSVGFNSTTQPKA